MHIPELLTADELAARLRVAPSTITRWRRQGIVPAIRINCTTFRFEFDHVLAALRSRDRQTAARPPNKFCPETGARNSGLH